MMAAPFNWHVVGDSHVNGFRFAAEQRLLDDPVEITEVGGATAVGLRNPNSITDALSQFKEALLPAVPGKVPVIQLGEVDCGFVIWYRAQKYGESVECQVACSVSAYFAFVDLLRASGYGTVVVSGATVPTIRDDHDWGEVANARREVAVSLAERTRLTISYNWRLAGEAAVRGLPYIDISAAVIDPATGVVADFFRHPDPLDHHLAPNRTGPLWAAELARIRREAGRFAPLR